MRQRQKRLRQKRQPAGGGDEAGGGGFSVRDGDTSDGAPQRFP